MAAFITAVVSAVSAVATWVGSSFIAKTVFNIAASFLVSKLINKSSSKSRSTQQGGRVQLPPQTNNKIPVLYGSAFINGIVTDARLISTDSKTNNVMYYCLTLSEMTNSGTIGVDNIYWNDVKLVFENAAGSQHRVLKGVKSVNGVDDYEDTNFKDGSKNLVEIRVYAGNSESAQQIYPQSDKVNAYDYWPADTDSKKYWLHADYGGKHGMQGLVFAIVRVEYNQEKGFTGLPNVTFKLNSTLNNPADVWQDFMTSNRYGANVDLSEIDTASVSAWRTHCNQYYNSGTSQWQSQSIGGQLPRYQINGIIDTGSPVKNNIDQILQNSAAWMSYDIAIGKWRVYPMAPQQATLTFNDDNIVGGIELTSTNLEDLYNELEVEYCDTSNFDQRLYAKDSVPAYSAGNPAGTRHPNEPDNKLSMTLDLINNNIQALRVGRIQLKQTRDDLVIQFTTSHVGLQAQAGDVINVFNSLYNWNTGSYSSGKPFRITRVKEVETQDGALLAEITAQEYNEDVYTEEATSAFTPSENIGISPIISIASPAKPTISLLENDSRPRITVTGTVPSGIIEGLEFWISYDTGLAESSRKYQLMRIERPASGSTFTTGASVSFTFDSIDNSNFIVKYRGFNRQAYGSFSTLSDVITFLPKPAAKIIDASTVLLDGAGNPVGDLTLPTLLEKVANTFTAADGSKTLADKVFEEFTQKTGFDIVKAATDGSLTGTSGEQDPEPSYIPTISNVTPTISDYLGGTEITVNGTLFIPTIQGASITTELLWNDVVTATISVSNTQIKFLSPSANLNGNNTVKVRTKATRNGILTTYVSASATVTSQQFKDLEAVVLQPPTRGRGYGVSETTITYQPYTGSYFAVYRLDSTLKITKTYTSFTNLKNATDFTGISRGEFARITGNGWLVLFDGNRFITNALIYATQAELLADTNPTGKTVGQYATVEHSNLNSTENYKIYKWSGSIYEYQSDLLYGIIITKTYTTLDALTSDLNPGIRAGTYAIVNTTLNNSLDNGKLYLWDGTSYVFQETLLKDYGFNFQLDSPLVANSGSAKLYRADGTLIDTLDYNEVTINQNVIEFPFVEREPGTDYYIIIDRGLAKTSDQILTAALDQNATKWTFTTSLVPTGAYVLADVYPNAGYSVVASANKFFGAGPGETQSPSLFAPLTSTPLTNVGYETIESVVPENAGTSVKRAIVTIRFRSPISILSGNILVQKASDLSVVATLPVTNGSISGTQFEYPGVIPNIEPNTRYRVVLPQGAFSILGNGTVLGTNSEYIWNFKTYPLVELLSYELDSTPYNDDTLRQQVNRRSNIQFTFGRKFLSGANDDTPFTMTGANSPSTIGIRTTPPTGAWIKLYKKTGDNLIEQVFLDKTFAADKVGVQFISNLGVITINFTESFDCDTEYYVLYNNLVYDQYWTRGDVGQFDKTQVTWTTDGIKITHVGHDPQITTGFFTIGFDRAVTPGSGRLRIYDETTGLIINELTPDDYASVFYDQTGTIGLQYSQIKD